MPSPFNPDEWPDGYGPGSGYSSGAGGNGGGGDEPPPYDDADAPPEDDEGLSADPSTGELLPAAPAGGSAEKKPRKKPATPEEQRAAFLDWVTRQIAVIEAYQQPIAQKPAWCPEWWKHPEVVQRLYVAWKGYIKATTLQAEGDGLAKSAWWVQHWDHHARIIFDKQQGPFRACNLAGHLADNDKRPLPITVERPPDDVALF